MSQPASEPRFEDFVTSAGFLELGAHHMLTERNREVVEGCRPYDPFGDLDGLDHR